MENLFGSGGGGRKVMIVAVAAAVVAAGVLVVGAIHTFSSSGRTAPARHFVCESCGHEWDAAMTADPKCPRCSERPVLKAHYRCPKCDKTFVGLDRQKLGVGKFRYRVPGTSEWLGEIPRELTCPHCRFTSADIYQRGLRARPGGAAPAPAAPREYE